VAQEREVDARAEGGVDTHARHHPDDDDLLEVRCATMVRNPGRASSFCVVLLGTTATTSKASTPLARAT
jgi:hypothetical protein